MLRTQKYRLCSKQQAYTRKNEGDDKTMEMLLYTRDGWHEDGVFDVGELYDYVEDPTHHSEYVQCGGWELTITEVQTYVDRARLGCAYVIWAEGPAPVSPDGDEMLSKHFAVRDWPALLNLFALLRAGTIAHAYEAAERALRAAVTGELQRQHERRHTAGEAQE